MSHYKPYPAYKDSGVEWLGPVPEKWQRTTLAYLADYLNGYPFAPEQWSAEGLPIIRIAQLTGKPFDNFYDGHAPSHLKVENGDLLFSWSATIDCFIWDRGEAWLNQHIFRVKPSHEASKGFLFHLLKHVAPKLAEFDAHGSTMRHIKKESLKEHIFIPDLATQETIATHLDRETTRIDALITKKTRFIELLREKRQALITHAVTKGLDPNVKMKDSGVEWLGEVPEHWTVASIKNWFKTSSGGTPDTSKQAEFYTQSGGYPWVRTTDLNNGELWDTEVRITEAALAASACSLLPENTVAVAMYGGEGTIGKFSIFRFPTTINQALCALLPNKHFVPEFVYWYIQHYRPYWMIGAESTRKDPNISQELIRAAPIVRPSLEEQLKISEQLSTVVGRIDALMEKTERSIELIKERRSALITSAVTGQIDLREAA